MTSFFQNQDPGPPFSDIPGYAPGQFLCIDLPLWALAITIGRQTVLWMVLCANYLPKSFLQIGTLSFLFVGSLRTRLVSILSFMGLWKQNDRRTKRVPIGYAVSQLEAILVAGFGLIMKGRNWNDSKWLLVYKYTVLKLVLAFRNVCEVYKRVIVSGKT